MSKLLGRQIGLDSAKKESVLTSDEILTWAENELLVLLRRERPYRFIGQRLKLPDNMHLYQAPLLPPTATPAPRHYLDWLPALPTLQPPQVAPNPKALPPATKIIMPQEEKKPSKRRRKQGWK
jgi:hypothetical protein